LFQTFVAEWIHQKKNEDLIDDVNGNRNNLHAILLLQRMLVIQVIFEVGAKEAVDYTDGLITSFIHGR